MGALDLTTTRATVHATVHAIACLTTALAATGMPARAQPSADAPVAPRRATLEASAATSRLSGTLPSGRALNLRANWAHGQDTILQAELLDERKFGDRGGVAAVGATHVLDPDWYVAGTATGGWGGPNWARTRLDGAVSRKWGAERRVVTTLGGYVARYEAGRSDRGMRVSLNYYMNHFAVFEAGATFNRSQPGGVRSAMPWLALSLGQEGGHLLSLRVSRGSEAWQAQAGGSVVPVDFDSTTVGADWRYWIAPDWGVVLRAERYVNPSYHRTTVGGGVFVQM